MNKAHAQSGFSIVEVIISSAILTIFAISLARMMGNQTKLGTRDQALLVRDSIYNRLLTVANNLDAIIISSWKPENANLRNCINPLAGVAPVHDLRTIAKGQCHQTPNVASPVYIMTSLDPFPAAYCVVSPSQLPICTSTPDCNCTIPTVWTGSPNALWTATGNMPAKWTYMTNLGSCVLSYTNDTNTGAGTCPNIPFNIAIYDENERRLVGPGANPVFYDSEGNITTDTTKAMFQAWGGAQVVSTQISTTAGIVTNRSLHIAVRLEHPPSYRVPFTPALDAMTNNKPDQPYTAIDISHFSTRIYPDATTQGIGSTLPWNYFGATHNGDCNAYEPGFMTYDMNSVFICTGTGSRLWKQHPLISN